MSLELLYKILHFGAPDVRFGILSRWDFEPATRARTSALQQPARRIRMLPPDSGGRDLRILICVHHAQTFAKWDEDPV